MAFTERYVTAAAGGGGAGTELDPWDLPDALTNAVAGDRVNILSDSGYSLGADTVSNAGTAPSLIVFRGYNSTIGDLEGLGRNAADGSLNTTNFPVITLTGTLTPNTLVFFESLKFTAALSGIMVSSASINNWGFVSCSLLNTQNNSGARCVLFNNNGRAINSDFECSGAAHGVLVQSDSVTGIYGCRFKAVISIALILNNGTVANSLFIGGSAVIGIDLDTVTGIVAIGNTFYGIGTAIQFINSAGGVPQILINNHVTDCAKFIDFLHSGTANSVAIEVNNRTRDNTTPRTGVGDSININEVTTDTGDDTTDFTDASTEDFTLISAAPGKDKGLDLGGFLDIGAYQRAEAGGSASGVRNPFGGPIG